MAGEQSFIPLCDKMAISHEMPFLWYKLTNAEKTKTLVACEFNPMPVRDDSSRSGENGNTEGHQTSLILQYSGSRSRDSTTSTQYHLVCQCVWPLNKAVHHSVRKSAPIRLTGNGGGI